MLLNAFLARYLSLFPLISFTSHHHQAANLSHVSHCIFRTKYGRGLNINSICFVSHPFWPLNEIFQDCSDCRNAICIYVHDQIKYFKIKKSKISHLDCVSLSSAFMQTRHRWLNTVVSLERLKQLG